MLFDAPIQAAPRLLDPLREAIRHRHYSLRTEDAYIYWARFFIRWLGEPKTATFNTQK